MKTQTIKISELSPAAGESVWQGSQTDFESPKDRIRVLGMVATATASDSVSGDGAPVLQEIVHVNRQNPSEQIFGTSIYARLGTSPVDNGIVLPLNVFVPCDFELHYPNYLGIVCEYSLPASATAGYGVTTYITFMYEEISDSPRRRR